MHASGWLPAPGNLPTKMSPRLYVQVDTAALILGSELLGTHQYSPVNVNVTRTVEATSGDFELSLKVVPRWCSGDLVKCRFVDKLSVLKATGASKQSFVILRTHFKNRSVSIDDLFFDA